GGKAAGVEENENMMRAMYNLMPGIQITIQDMVAEGDKVVCRNSWRWKDAASGKAMEFHGFVQWRFENNQIAERWATVTPPREAVCCARRGGSIAGFYWIAAMRPAAHRSFARPHTAPEGTTK